jgi:hypothetical protein
MFSIRASTSGSKFHHEGHEVLYAVQSSGFKVAGADFER